MKQIFALIMALSMVLVTTPLTVHAANEIKKISAVLYPNVSFYYDKQKAADNTLVINYRGTSYLPIRYISEKLGKEINWDGDTYSISVGQRPTQLKKSAIPNIDIGEQLAPTNQYKQIEVTLYPITFYFDGQKDQQQKPGYFDNGDEYVPLAILFHGTTYVPIRYISQKFDKQIGWDGDSKSIWLGQKPEVQENNNYGIFSVVLGETGDDVKNTIGEPDRIDFTVYEDSEYWIYNKDYKINLRLLINKNKVVQIYSFGTSAREEIKNLYTNGLNNNKEFHYWNDDVNIYIQKNNRGQKNFITISNRKFTYKTKELTDDVKQQLTYRQKIRLLDDINTFRIENGFEPIKFNANASEEATNLSNQWLNKQFFFGYHTDSALLHDIAEKLGYNEALETITPGLFIRYTRDNLGLDEYEISISSNERMVFGLLSRDEKEKLLDPDVKEIGIGVGKYGGYVTGLFLK